MKVFHFGVMGLWIGMTVGLCVISFFGTGLVLKSDWATIADEANARLNRSASGNALASDKF
jgi:Na+-driven multidrug efflux pump